MTAFRFDMDYAKAKSSFKGKSGGGKSNPLVDELVANIKSLQGGKVATISRKAVAEQYGVEESKATPNNIVYSFFKRTGSRMSYRQGDGVFYLYIRDSVK